MTRRPRFRRRAACVVAVALLSGACVAVPGEETLPPLAAAQQASVGGTLRVGVEPPGSIVPTLASSPSGRLIASLVCDTLVHLDPVTGEALPALAEQFVVSGDGLTITFKLRRGVLMHDGSELTANDVVASIHRLANPDEGSYLQGLLEGVVGFGQYSGRELEEGEPRPSRMGGVETLERYNLQIRLRSSNPQFVRNFAHPALAPLSEAAHDANPIAAARDPVCAGPYEIDGTYDQDADRVRLVRDEGFVGASPALTNAGQGYAETIDFQVYPDAQAVLAAYDAGEVDVARVPSERFAAVADQHGDDVIDGPSPTVEYVGLPVTGLATALGIEPGPRERFDELAARHVLSLALDRDAIASRLYDGARLPATSFTPPSAGPYHEREDGAAAPAAVALPATSTDAAVAVEGGTHYCRSLLPPDGDREHALDLLRDAVVLGPDGGRSVSLQGTTVPFYFNDEFGNAAFVEAIAREWEATLGVQIRPVALTWEEYLDRATSGAGFDGFYRLSWSDPGLVPESYLRALAEDVGPANFGRFADETVTRLLAELGQVGGDDHRLEYQELEDVLCAMLPAIPVTFARSRWLVRGEDIGTARDLVIGWDGQVLLRELFVRG